MTYGFRIYNAAGVEIISNSRYGISLIDRFTVDPGSSGERTYPNFEDMTFEVVQTQQEPSTISYDMLRAFNLMNISITETAGVKKVSWSPRFSMVAAYPVDIFVLGI